MPQLNNILVALSVQPQERHKQAFIQAAPGVSIVFKQTGEVTQEDLNAAQAVFGVPSPAKVAAAKNLQWIQLSSAGCDRYVNQEGMNTEALLTTANGAYGVPIAEHMLGMLLMLMKNLHLYRDNQRESLWQNRGDFRWLCSSTVLVVGLGDLGGEFARRIRAMGAKVLGVRKSAAPSDVVDELFAFDQMDEALAQADVVALCVPSTPETNGLISRERLSRMKPGAYLLNTGRGDAIDTDALVEALQSGQLAGAGLDVTDPEPLPETHPLWQCANAVITPHCSGGFTQMETVDRTVEICADNLRRYLADLPLRNVVDWATGLPKR